jgi:hypothetical protein
MWEQVREAAQIGPQIAFEQACGWRRVPAFVQTWATVLLLPWVFARQVVLRVGGRMALAFGAACFAWTLLSFLFGADLLFVCTWWTVAIIYLALQTPLLFGLDKPHWSAGSLRFWSAVGGYTSAVVATEFAWGPPFISLEYLWSLVSGSSPGYLAPSGFGTFVQWLQMILWLSGLSTCFAARLRHRGVGGPALWAVGSGVWVLLLLLYAAVLQYIAPHVYEAYDRLL